MGGGDIVDFTLSYFGLLLCLEALFKKKLLQGCLEALFKKKLLQGVKNM